MAIVIQCLSLIMLSCRRFDLIRNLLALKKQMAMLEGPHVKIVRVASGYGIVKRQMYIVLKYYVCGNLVHKVEN